MSTSQIQTGAHSTVSFLFEDDGYGETPTDSNHKPFGKDVKLRTFQGSRNAVALYRPDTRDVAEFIEQQFSGAFSVEFVLSLNNPWFNSLIIDNPSTTGAEAPYTHEFDGESPRSFRIISANTKSGEEYTLEGAFVNNASFNVRIPGNVTVSLDGVYSSLDVSNPGTPVAQPVDSGRPATFANAEIDLGGTVRSLVQALQFRISNNSDPIYQIGAEEAVQFSPKARQLSIDHTRLRTDEDDEDIERFLGGSSLGRADRDDIVVTINNGESGSAQRQLKYTFTDSMPNDFQLSGTGDPAADVQANISERPTGVTAEAINAASSQP